MSDEKDLARLIVDPMVSFDVQLGELDTLIGRIEDDDERQYPDLNPDK